MAIFPDLIFEPIVQFKDKFRIDATHSFTSSDEAAVTLVRIRPTATAAWIEVTGSSKDDWFLDWAYSGITNITEEISVEITTDGLPFVESQTISLVTEVSDYLFSKDSDLIIREHDLMNWLRPGKNSYINFHRLSQTRMVEWFNERGTVNVHLNKLDKVDFIDKEELALWSIKLTLHYIFLSLNDQNDDHFKTKATDYASEAAQHRDRAFFKVDLDGDGTLTDGERTYIGSIPIVM